MFDPIEEGFQHLGVVRGGILFLSATNALTVLEQCRTRGIGVLGVDGFHLSEEETRPVQEHSLDVSAAHSADERLIRVERFVQDRLSSGLHFEIVLEDG